MILVCPSCGATHSAEAWENDRITRTVFAAQAALPREVCAVLLPYLALFRPDKRALSWSRTLKVMQELAALIAPGWVQVQGKPARECPRCHAALGAESRIRRIKTRAEKLDAVSHLSQSERDAKYLQTLRWVAENRVRIRSLEGQRKWALDKFRARWNREPEVAA